MKYFGATDKGKIRKTNQDSYVIVTSSANEVLAIVCDGIGGGQAGDVASSIAVGHFSEVFSNNQGFLDAKDAKAWLKKEISAANMKILTLGNEQSNLKGMGTTLTGVLLSNSGTFVINIGDSRTYSFSKKNKRLDQLTMDHNLANDMLMHGEITKEEAKNFPKKNVLTNALGVWESVRMDIDTHSEEIDGFLICSDGLHGYVPKEEIENILFDTSMEHSRKVKKMIKKALDAGGYDNVTVILIDLERS